MSDTSSLSELARFTAKSPLTAGEAPTRRAALDALARQIAPQPAHRKITDLLGAVLALKSRTRRLALPPANVELDVFSPSGARAVRMRLGG